MTDRSNYGPVRRLSPSVSTDNRKPYSRTGLKGVLGAVDWNSGDTAVPTPPDSPYYPFHVEIPQLEAPSQNRNSAPDGPRDVAGFPTYEQYRRIEDEYLSSLSERKQPKALISQALFDKIFAVLQNGSEDRGSTAQFRFWVRKMFVLSYPQTSFNQNAGQTPEPVVLHDKRPVAIREQLYDVLCYCHAVARHGGRDKTCAMLRIKYSWVPKELTAKFVKACPTCTLKRSGNPDLLSRFGQTVSSPYAAPTVPAESASLFSGGPNDSPQGLSFVVGSEGCDDGSGSGSCFGSSMFATPDLSVYPSPTLSAGSFGPTTPSPYLHSGLFGYPAMFDPGHGSLSSMAGWDPSSLSPCGPMYAEELRASISKQQQQSPMSAEEIIDNCARSMQLQLPTPKVVRSLCTRACGGDDTDGCGVDPLPRTADTPCPIDVNNIDPTLLMERGYRPLALVRCTQMAAGDSDADTTDPGASGSDGNVGPYMQQQQPPQFGLAIRTTTPAMGSGAGHHRMPEPASTPGPRRRLALPPPCPEAPATATDACSFDGGAHELQELSLPPRPGGSSTSSPLLPGGGSVMGMGMFSLPMPAGGSILLLCGHGDDDDGAQEGNLEDAEVFEREREREREMGVIEDADVDGVEGAARWDSPEAWLVQSDSIDEASDAVV